MKNLYHKVAVASVSTVLSFVMGANKEAKAATFTEPPTIQFGVHRRFNLLGDTSHKLTSEYDRVEFTPVQSGGIAYRLAEFNISSFFIAPNTIIKSAVFQDKFSRILKHSGNSLDLGIFGYIGNGTAEVSDVNKGGLLSIVDILSLSPGDTFNVDVTRFVNQQVRDGNPFAGFVISSLSNDAVSLGGTDAFGRSSLVIETVDAAEPVPEPTTIFGSALAISLGWLKRKKSSQQNKTTP
jgi:hypothetical protein